jgi:hypothetical protein
MHEVTKTNSETETLESQIALLQNELARQRMEIEQLKQETAIVPAEPNKPVSRRRMLKGLAIATAGAAAAGVSLMANSEIASANNDGPNTQYGLSVAPTGVAFLDPGGTEKYGILARTDAGGATFVNAVDAGVAGISTNGYGGIFRGGNAAIRLIKDTANSGQPVTGVHNEGELYVDKDGALFYCVQGGTGLAAVWVILASDRTRQIRLLENPYRIRIVRNPPVAPQTAADLLQSQPGTPTNGTIINVRVGDLPTNQDGVANPIPNNAIGIVGALTSVGATAPGNLRIFPSTSPVPNAATLNIPAFGAGTLNITGSFTSRLGTDGKVKIAYSAAAGNFSGYVIDVTAYYVQAS